MKSSKNINSEEKNEKLEPVWSEITVLANHLVYELIKNKGADQVEKTLKSFKIEYIYR